MDASTQHFLSFCGDLLEAFPFALQTNSFPKPPCRGQFTGFFSSSPLILSACAMKYHANSKARCARYLRRGRMELQKETGSGSKKVELPEGLLDESKGRGTGKEQRAPETDCNGERGVARFAYVASDNSSPIRSVWLACKRSRVRRVAPALRRTRCPFSHGRVYRRGAVAASGVPQHRHDLYSGTRSD